MTGYRGHVSKSAKERRDRFVVVEGKTNEADQDRPAGGTYNEQLLTLSEILMDIWQHPTTAESETDTGGRLRQASCLFLRHMQLTLSVSCSCFLSLPCVCVSLFVRQLASYFLACALINGLMCVIFEI